MNKLHIIISRILLFTLLLCGFEAYGKNATNVGLSAKNVEVRGNERIDKNVIIAYLDFATLMRSNVRSAAIQKMIDEALEKMHKSELFLESNISLQNDKIVIEVKENPIVLEIKFEGNKKIETENLQQELSLKKRGIFTKSKLQSDIKRINDIYLKSGRFLTVVTPKIVQKDQNRVEIVFDVKEGKKAVVSEIYLVGNNNFSDADLLNEISTKTYKWYKFLSSADSYDSDRIEFDKERLRRFYGARGYADFTTLSAVAQISPTKDKFFVNFLLEEGIKYNLGEIEIVNRIEKLDTAILKKAVLIKKGKLYNADLIEKTVDKMVEILSEHSYAFANVEPVLKRNKEKKIIDIDFTIEQTPKIYINQIKITGNTRTMDEVIRRELRVKEGDAYNLNKVNRSKQRIQNLGFFDKVEFKTSRINNSNKVDLIIEVKEKKTGELNLSLGYSTVNQLTIGAGVKESNLFGTGQELGVNIQKSTFSLNNDINYTKPYFMGRSIDVGFDLFDYYLSKRNTLVYDQKSTGATFRGDYSITEYLKHQIRYSWREESVENIDAGASTSIKSIAGSYVNSTIGQTFLYDKRNNRMDPRDGYYVSITQDYTGVGGDIKTLKHEGSAGYYIPTFNEDFVLKFLLKGGAIEGVGQDVRSNYGFFLGGNNFRGFQYAGLGPRTVINNSAVGGNVVGGKKYYVGTAEFRFPLGLPKELGIYGILFSDNGTVKGVDQITRNNAQIADSGSMRSSYGFSLAWSSPLGPLRLDFSRVAKKEEYDQTQNFRFNFGTSF